MKGRAKASPAPPIEYSLLLTATLCLLALGAVMVFSASSAESVLSGGGDGAHYLKRTIIFAAIGLSVMRLLTLKGVRLARALTPLLLVASLALLAAVLVSGAGLEASGSRRWIGAGALQFQPAELAKLAIILYGAHLLAARPRRARTLRGLAPFLLVVAVACLLIAVQPDLGSATVAGLGAFVLLLAAGVRLRTLAPVGVAIVVAALAMVATHPYQQERVLGFLDPSADPSGSGFQASQATLAVGSGGLLGVGLGESVQKAFYLPEAHTDMVAAVAGEELGLVGMAALIGLLGLFGYAGFRAAHRARDRYSALLAAGLTSLILAQAIVNLFAVLGLAPLTGVTLPFVSYGGSSLVVTLAAAGLLLDVARGRTAVSALERRRPGGGAKAGAGRGGRKRGSAASAAKLHAVRGDRPRKHVAAPGRHRRGRNRGARGAGDRRRRRVAR